MYLGARGLGDLSVPSLCPLCLTDGVLSRSRVITLSDLVCEASVLLLRLLLFSPAGSSSSFLCERGGDAMVFLAGRLLVLSCWVLPPLYQVPLSLRHDEKSLHHIIYICILTVWTSKHHNIKALWADFIHSTASFVFANMLMTNL